MDLFLDEARIPVEDVSAPERVETAVASVWKRRRLMTPVGGGVSIQPRLALAPESILADESGGVAAKQQEIDVDRLAPDRWWWD